MSETYTTFELEAMTDRQLAEAYENTFAECYPCQPSAYPDFFLYAGIDEDPRLSFQGHQGHRVRGTVAAGLQRD